MAQLMALQRYTQTAQEQFDAANTAVAVASGAHVLATSTPQRVSKRGRPSPNCADNSPQFTSPPAFSFHNSAAVYSPAARSRHSLAGGLQTQEDDVDTKLQLEHLFYKEEKRHVLAMIFSIKNVKPRRNKEDPRFMHVNTVEIGYRFVHRFPPTF